MTDPSSPPPLASRVATAAPARPAVDLTAPDARELGGLAVVAAAVALAHVGSLGERLALRWRSPDSSGTAQSDTLLQIAVQFAPWLLGLAILSVLFARRWLPRVQQRMLEPSLIAAWVTVALSAALAWLAMRSEVWPFTWQTTSPSTAALVARMWSAGHVLALALWLALWCLLVPLLSELLMRHALLSWLRRRGVPAWGAVASSAAVFGTLWFVSGVQAAPDAALRHGAVAFVGGLALGTLAVRGARGRGLGLCVVAHVAWMATEAWWLIRGLPAS